MKDVVKATKWLYMIVALAVLAPWSTFLNPSTASAATGSLKVHMLSQDDGRNDSFIFELPNGEVMVLDNYVAAPLSLSWAVWGYRRCNTWLVLTAMLITLGA